MSVVITNQLMLHRTKVVFMRLKYRTRNYVLCEWKKNSPVTGLEWPRGFQKVKVPRLHDNGTGWW